MLIKTGFQNHLHGCDFLCSNLMNEFENCIYTFLFFQFYSLLNWYQVCRVPVYELYFPTPLLILGLDIVILSNNKQLLDEVEHDIMNYQNRGLCYLICFWGEHSKGLSNQADVAFIMSSSQAIVNWLNALDQSHFS